MDPRQPAADRILFLKHVSAIASLEKFNSGKKIPGFSTNTRAAVHVRITYPRRSGKLLGSRGSWTKPGQTGFAGFKFSKSTKMGVPQIVYGWIRLKWTDSPLLFFYNSRAIP